MKSARDRGRQNNMVSLTGKIFKIYKGTHLKHKILRIQPESISLKSNNKWAGIKSEVPITYTQESVFVNDNPPSRINALSWQRDSAESLKL